MQRSDGLVRRRGLTVVGLTGVAAIVALACEGSSGSKGRDDAQSAGGNPATGTAGNDEAGGGLTGGDSSIGGDFGAFGGASVGGAVGSGGGEENQGLGGSSSASVTGADAVITENEVGERCLDPSRVACIAGRARERVRCLAETASWGLNEACPVGTECVPVTAGCLAPRVGCDGHVPGERYCLNIYGVWECGEDSMARQIDACVGHCMDGRCENGPAACLAFEPIPTYDCNCGCPDAAWECSDPSDSTECAVDLAEQTGPLRLIGAPTFDELKMTCGGEEPVRKAAAWYLENATGWVRATAGDGAGIFFWGPEEDPQRCVDPLKRCAVAWQPTRVGAFVPPGTPLPTVVILEELDREEPCP